MPTATATQCYNCRRTDMSIFEGICNQCFDRHYVLCEDCGVLLYRSRSPVRNRNYSIQHANQFEGNSYCRNCWYERRNSCDFYWPSKPLDISITTYQRIRSKRKYGVEIETSRCNNPRELHKHTNFGCKDDPTISGHEFYSPILYGDEGFKHINELLTYAEKNNWEVDSNCGCHTHYDMRDESDEQLYRITYAYNLTSRLWKCCVPRSRARNNYCNSTGCSGRSIERAYQCSRSFESFASSQDRYTYFNLYAYCDHHTFEVRLLEGTLDAETICNWIAIHAQFMDYVKELSFEQLRSQFNCNTNIQFRVLVDLINDAGLIDWLAARARYIGRRPLRGPGSVNRR